jgi:hypothetical protein
MLTGKARQVYVNVKVNTVFTMALIIFKTPTQGLHPTIIGKV